MSKETFPSMALIDPKSTDDIVGRIISEDKSNGNIWYMFVTFYGDIPEFVASVNISQSGVEGQSIGIKYASLKGARNPILYSYNDFMFKRAAEDNDLEYNNKADNEVLPIESNEEFSLAADIYTNGNGGALDKIASEMTGAGYSNMYSLYNACFGDGTAILSKDAASDYCISIARYNPPMLASYVQIDGNTIKEFANYRPIIYKHLFTELNKKAKSFNNAANKKMTASKIGGWTSIATGIVSGLTGAAINYGANQNIVSSTGDALEGIINKHSTNTKKGDVFSKSAAPKGPALGWLFNKKQKTDSENQNGVLSAGTQLKAASTITGQNQQAGVQAQQTQVQSSASIPPQAPAKPAQATSILPAGNKVQPAQGQQQVPPNQVQPPQANKQPPPVPAGQNQPAQVGSPNGKTNPEDEKDKNSKPGSTVTESVKISNIMRL